MSICDTTYSDLFSDDARYKNVDYLNVTLDDGMGKEVYVYFY